MYSCKTALVTYKCKKTKESWYLVGIAWILLILWNCACSFVDVATSHVLSVPFDEESRISFGFQMLTMAIFPAIVEEFAFRKVIFGVLRKYGFSLAAIFSSLCFGLMHQNVIQINKQYTYKDMMADIGCCFKRVPVIIFTIFCIGMSVAAIIINV